MDLYNIKFKDIFKPILIGWSVGVITLFWALLFFMIILAGISSDSIKITSEGAPMSGWEAAAMFLLGIPAIAVGQGLMVSCLCYFGIVVYRTISRVFNKEL